ncbi:MAG TPA: hypothetical protein VFJ49_05365 [Methyloceanibacter sp.]|nr:hypothetical protein [Methyloceanibacter sp.]
MRSKLTLLTTAAALAFGLTATSALAADATGDAPGAKSDITIVGTNQGGVAGGAATQAAPDQGNAALPDSGNPAAAAQGSPLASDGGGAAAQGGTQDQGAAGAPAAKPDTQKQGQLPSPSSSY